MNDTEISIKKSAKECRRGFYFVSVGSYKGKT